MAVNSVIHLSILTISDDFPILILGNIKDVIFPHKRTKGPRDHLLHPKPLQGCPRRPCFGMPPDKSSWVDWLAIRQSVLYPGLKGSGTEPNRRPQLIDQYLIDSCT